MAINIVSIVRAVRATIRRYFATHIVVAIMDGGTSKEKRKVHYAMSEKEAMEWLAAYSSRTTCYIYRMLPQHMDWNLIGARYASHASIAK